MKCHRLRHTIGMSADDASTMCAVTVYIQGTRRVARAALAAAEDVVGGNRPALEVGVGGQDAGVEDVHVHTGTTCIATCEVRLIQAGPGIDPVQSPRRGIALLLHGDRHVLLHEQDIARL